MNIESIRSALMNKLNVHFNVNSIKSYPVDPRDFRQPTVRAKEVVAFEFIINGSERYITFGTELSQGVMFTRPKEGIVKHLAHDVREHDFYFRLTNDVYERHDLIGRLIENWINISACTSMHNLLQTWQAKSGNDFSYCLGYKITRHHKQTMTFDGELEVLVDKGIGSYAAYNCSIVNGHVDKIHHDGKQLNSLHEIFGA